MAYYLFDGKGAVGPFTLAELLKRPDFDAATLLLPTDAWKPAAAFPEIAAALNPAASPPPQPARPWEPRTGITLSLGPQKPLEPAPPAAPAASAPPAAPADELASPASKLVLVVDDDESVRSFIEMLAATEGFQVITAVNGHDAAAKLAARPADLIVTDLMMPGQGGYEFLRSLQAADGPRVPIFVVSASDLDDSTINVIREEANVVEFVAKPIRSAAFVSALHKHLKTAPRR